MATSFTLADGQLAAAAATLLGTDTAGRVVTIICHNGSATLTETVRLLVSRGGGTARNVARAILAPHEQLCVVNLCLDPSDVLSGFTTDAATVDYLVQTGSGGSTFQTYSLDVYGALKQGALIASNQTISGNQSVTGNLSLTGTLTAPDAAAASAAAGTDLAEAAGAGDGVGAGGIASLTGGASGGGATGNGGVGKVVGGAATSTNGTGGAAQVTGGLGKGSGAGGAAPVTGGASTASSSGNGGAASLTGGALGTSGTGVGGGVAVAGGAGRSGGTAGSVTINSGAANSGTPGTVTINSAVAPAAGGSAQAALLCTSTAKLGVYFGTGVPSFSAAKGSLYLCGDATTTTTRIYVASDGAGTWTALTTAA